MLRWVALSLLALWYLSWTLLLLWGVSLLRLVEGPCQRYSELGFMCVTIIQMMR